MSPPLLVVVPPAGEDNNPRDWMRHGACVGHDIDLWFPAKGVRSDAAKQVCATCPVIGLCFDYALETNQRAGIWGGVSERTRRRIRAARRASQALPPVSGAGAGGGTRAARFGTVPALPTVDRAAHP